MAKQATTVSVCYNSLDSNSVSNAAAQSSMLLSCHH